MKNILLIFVFLVSGSVSAQEIIMATSEDLKEFDQLVGQKKPQAEKSAAGKDNEDASATTPGSRDKRDIRDRSKRAENPRAQQGSSTETTNTRRTRTRP